MVAMGSGRKVQSVRMHQVEKELRRHAISRTCTMHLLFLPCLQHVYPLAVSLIETLSEA
jgi:hypothetical protein